MKQKILIGPLNKKDIGSIPTLNRAFVNGLSDKYSFIPINIVRKYGKSNVSNFNLINIFYFIKQYLVFVVQLLYHRPTMVHYAITSNWNFEKSLIFLNTAKLLGAKRAIGHLHGGSFDVFMNNLKGKRKTISFKFFNKLDAVLVASDYWKGFLKKIEVDTLVAVVNNPIDGKYVDLIDKSKRVRRNGNFLFIGSLGERKGFYDIIEVVKSINDRFVIDAIGSEDRKNDIVKISNLISQNQLSSKINIALSEKLNLQDKVKYFTQNEVFLFPSHNENFPLVIIEAACAGMPIITTPVGAIPEYFTNMKNIYFVEPGNIEQIKSAIQYMIQNPEERIRMGKAAKKLYIEKLSSKIIMNQLDKVYKELLN